MRDVYIARVYASSTLNLENEEKKEKKRQKKRKDEIPILRTSVYLLENDNKRKRHVCLIRSTKIPPPKAYRSHYSYHVYSRKAPSKDP